MRRKHERAGGFMSTILALESALAERVPVGVECVALVRGPRPRTAWAWLWDRLGLWLALRAGFTAVWPGGWRARGRP